MTFKEFGLSVKMNVEMEGNVFYLVNGMKSPKTITCYVLNL
jgi:hypothetical protein